MTFWNGCALSEVLEGLTLVELSYFKSHGLMPFVIAILFINEHRLLVVSWNLMSAHTDWSVAVVLETDLVDCPS